MTVFLCEKLIFSRHYADMRWMWRGTSPLSKVMHAIEYFNVYPKYTADIQR
jgi:hypothetical protein